MPRRIHGSVLSAIATGFLLACSHTDPVATVDVPREGPFGAASPVRLTLNPGQDLFPTYSDDGASILYTYEAVGRRDHDRCIGILPAAGGTRLAEICETRPGSADSTDAVTSGALDSSGRLLFLQATSRIGAGLPHNTRLRLSDTTYGTAPRTLLTFPLNVGGAAIDWLTNIRWTGDNTFLALGQLMTLVPLGGAARDTVFFTVAVFRGTISGQTATLAPIDGTGGVNGYAVSDDGTAVIVASGAPVGRVPITGGPRVPIPLAGMSTFSDVDCQRGQCIGLSNNVLWGFPEAGGTPVQLNVSSVPFWSVPRLSPLNGDVVLATAFAARDLYLFRGLL